MICEGDSLSSIYLFTFIRNPVSVGRIRSNNSTTIQEEAADRVNQIDIRSTKRPSVLHPPQRGQALVCSQEREVKVPAFFVFFPAPSTSMPSGLSPRVTHVTSAVNLSALHDRAIYHHRRERGRQTSAKDYRKKQTNKKGKTTGQFQPIDKLCD